MAAAVVATRAFALPAFPGAEGFGANAVGGRGGDVYHVTTLDPDVNHVIPGSLNYGLYVKNVPGSGTVPGIGRTIVFDVGGTIYCNTGTITFKDIHNVTIAGQTAPGPGITIIGDTFGITGNTDAKPTHDVVVRYLTVRKGAGNGDDGMHVQGTANTHDVILDHISGSWSEDEVISATQTATNVTIQNSIMSEALTSNHAYGSLIRPTVNSQISYNHNLYSNQKSRNPRPGTYDGMTLDFEFQNNVIYNWSDRAGYIAGADTDVQHVNMNYVGNYLIAGPATVDSGGNTRRSIAFYKEVNTNPLDLHFFQENNKIDSNNTGPIHTLDGADLGWNAFKTISGTTVTAFPGTDEVGARFAYPVSSPDSPDVAYAKAISNVGNMPWARNDVDKRLIGDVLNYTGTAPITAPDPTEWNNLVNQASVSRAAGFDTDQDGMPNAWETDRGYNPAVADNNVVTADGYTRLEHYLNYLTYVANWNADADGNWSDYLSWRGDRPTGVDSTANFVSGITAPRVITVDLPVTVGQLTFDGPMSYTLAGPNTITLDVFSGIARIDVSSGIHTIAAPVALSKDAVITVKNGGDLLSFTGNVSAAGRTITKAGAGVAQFENVRASALNVSAGLVRISEKPLANDPGGTSSVQSLAVSGGAGLDLTNNSMVLDYSGGSPLASIQSMLASGYAGGSWTGAGIASSTAANVAAASSPHLTAIGYGEKTDIIPGSSTFAGQTVDDSTVLLAYVLAGDTNLDGQVDTIDFNQLAANFGNNANWVGGNVNYDNVVDTLDFNLLAANFGQSLPAASLGALIPEPASPMLLLSGCLMAARRGRRRS